MARFIQVLSSNEYINVDAIKSFSIVRDTVVIEFINDSSKLIKCSTDKEVRYMIDILCGRYSLAAVLPANEEDYIAVGDNEKEKIPYVGVTEAGELMPVCLNDTYFDIERDGDVSR